MNLLNYFFYFLIEIHNNIMYCENHEMKHCTKISSIKTDGSFKIIAFIPVNNEHPEKMIIDGVLSSEVLIFAVNEFNAKCGRNIIGYTIFDTCSFDEFDVTTEGLLQTLFNNNDHENVPHENSTLNEECRCLDRHQELSSVIGIISAISSKTAYINKMLSYHRLPLISFASTSTELSDPLLYPYLYRTIANDKFQAMFLIKFLMKLNWTFISIINSDDTYGRAGADALISTSSICAHLKKTLPLPANSAAIQSIMENIRHEIKSNVIVIWGHIDLVKIILEAADFHRVENKIWIISESAGLDPWIRNHKLDLKGDVLVVIPNGGKYERFENYFLNLTLHKSNHSDWLRTFFALMGVNSTINQDTRLKMYQNLFPLKYAGFMYSAVTTYLKAFSYYAHDTSNCDLFLDKLCEPRLIRSHTQFADHYIETVKFKDLLNEDFQFDENGDAQSGAFELHIVCKNQNRFELIANWSSLSGDVSLKSNFWRFNVSKKSSKCSEQCKAGFFSLSHGKAEVKQCCWECAPCLEGTVKPYPGKGECTPCPDTHSNNENNTECILLVDIFIKYNDAMGLTIIAISVLGVCVTCCLIAVFIVQRDSLIVRSANLIPSLLQLIIHNFLFLLPYLFFGEDTSEKCITRTFAAGLLFTLIISITLSKVSHVSNLFRLKQRISDRERNQMITKQVVIITTPALLQIGIMITFMSIHPVEVQRVSLANLKFKIHNDCDVSFHLTGQLIFLTALEALCCIKGFLARKLPDIYNETKYITFAMFTSLIVMLLSVPLIGSYQTSEEKNFVLAIVILIANLLILLILYSYKMYFIFCGVEKQTTLSSASSLCKSKKRRRTTSTFTIDSIYRRESK